MTSMQDYLLELARIKEAISNLNEEKLETECLLIEALEKKGQKSVTANNGDITGTLVKGSTISIDEEKLKKSLGAALWKKVTKQVLDKERLEAHIVTGDVDANVVAAASTEKDRKPFIKVTGTYRQPKGTGIRTVSPGPAVTTKNSSGGTKPAAKRRTRVVKAARPRS